MKKKLTKQELRDFVKEKAIETGKTELEIIREMKYLMEQKLIRQKD